MSWTDIVMAVFKGPAAYLWPMIVLPALAGIASYWAARLLPPFRADWRVAAVLTALPGLVMLMAILAPLWDFRHLLEALHRPFDLEHHFTSLIACLVIVNAILRATRREISVRRLMGLALPPSQRLLRAGEKAGVRVRELPTTNCECFVAGLLKPTAFVSRGALDRLDDEGLEAALHHERVHAAGFDPAMLSMLWFFRDLAPGGGRAMEAYRQSRERLADRRAVGAVGSVALASALLALIRQPARSLPLMSINGPGAGTWRLEAILGRDAATLQRPLRLRLAVASACVLNLALVAWPWYNMDLKHLLLRLPLA
jgi:Zn-dependent protease with chaperone function